MSWKSMHGDWIAEDDDGGWIGPVLVLSVCFGPLALALWVLW